MKSLCWWLWDLTPVQVGIFALAHRYIDVNVESETFCDVNAESGTFYCTNVGNECELFCLETSFVIVKSYVTPIYLIDSVLMLHKEMYESTVWNEYISVLFKNVQIFIGIVLWRNPFYWNWINLLLYSLVT